MRVVLCFSMMFASLAFCNVDIVPAGDGSDYLWLTWVDHDCDSVYVARYLGAVLEEKISFTMCFGYPIDPGGRGSVSLIPDELDHQHLVFIPSRKFYVDSVYCIDPTGEMEIQSKASLSSWPGWFSMYNYNAASLLRYPELNGKGLLCFYAFEVYSSGESFFWGTMEYSVDSEFGVWGDFFLEYSDPYPMENKSGIYNSFLDAPVVSDQGNPLLACYRVATGGGGYPGREDIMALSHNPSADSLNLSVDYLYQTESDDSPGISALGSCTDDIVLLWWNNQLEFFYSIYDGISTTSVGTWAFSGSGPEPNYPSALTANPLDEGMLLAWQDSQNNIMCRHYQDEWNGYAQLAVSDAGVIDEEDLAVCSVEYGYWIAWLSSDASVPELVFIPRDSVTSIENNEEDGTTLALDFYPNPFYNSLALRPAGYEGVVHIEIFDTSGRLVNRESTSNNREVVWTPSEVPSGNYIVRITSEEETLVQNVVLLNR